MKHSSMVKLLETAGIKDVDTAIDKMIVEMTRDEQIIYKMDKWMPDDSELQDEYYEIKTEEEMVDFLQTNADEDALRRYGFRGDWHALAKIALNDRK
jgi:hypothetical protein